MFPERSPDSSAFRVLRRTDSAHFRANPGNTASAVLALSRNPLFMTVHRLFWAALLICSAGAAGADNVVSSTAVIDPARLSEPNYLSSWQASFQNVVGSNPPAIRVTYNAIWGGIWQHR